MTSMSLDSSRPLLIRLFAVAVLMLVLPMAVLSWRALGAFEQTIKPEMDRKAAAIGRDVTAQVDRAVRYGIPLGQLVGVDDFFAPLLESNPEIRYLAITDDLGRVLFLRGAEAGLLEPHYRVADPDLGGADGRVSSIGAFVDLTLPVEARGTVQGFVHVGFAEDYVASRLTDILYDVGVVLAVALIVAFEILLFVVSFNITGPLKRVGLVAEKAGHGDFSQIPGVVSGDEVGRFVRAVGATIRRLDERYRGLAAHMDEVRAAHFDRSAAERVGEIQARINAQFRFAPQGKPGILFERRAVDIRLALFLFVFAEELSRSFLPLYAGQMAPSLAGLGIEMVMALPIALFMACTALASPMGGRLAERLGARRLFLWGMVPALFGHFMSGLAQGAFDLVLWRAVTGIGYAVVTMACQSYMADAVREDSRAQGLGAFLGAVLTAGLCGTVMGGVLAERFGFRIPFFVSAGLVLLAGALVWRLMAGTALAAADPAPPPRLLRLLRNWRFSVLMAFAAVPAKMALTGFVFFLVPVALMRAGWTVGEIARLMVLYPLVMALVTPLAARLSDRLGWGVGLVAMGGLVGGIGLLAPLVLPGPWALAVGIVALALSQGLSATPLLSMLADVCWTEYRAMGRTNVLGFMRFIERLGSTAGPLLAAGFLAAWGVGGAMLALGVLVLVPAALFAVLSAAYGGGPHIETEEDAP